MHTDELRRMSMCRRYMENYADGDKTNIKSWNNPEGEMSVPNVPGALTPPFFVKEVRFQNRGHTPFTDMDFASAFMLTAFIEILSNTAPMGMFLSLLTLATEAIRDVETYSAQTSATRIMPNVRVPSR